MSALLPYNASITIHGALRKDAEYRTAADGNALVLLYLSGPVEAKVVYVGGVEGHLKAEMLARRCRTGMQARVSGSALVFRADHGEATHVLRGLLSAQVGSEILL